MAAQVASATSLNSSPPSELKTADRDPKEESSVPGEKKQQENKEPGLESGSPGSGELYDRGVGDEERESDSEQIQEKRKNIRVVVAIVEEPQIANNEDFEDIPY